MTAETVTIPRQAALEAAAFLDATVRELSELGADSEAMFKLQEGSWGPLAAELDDDDAIRARAAELAGELRGIVGLDIARRVTALEEKRDEADLRLAQEVGRAVVGRERRAAVPKRLRDEDRGARLARRQGQGGCRALAR